MTVSSRFSTVSQTSHESLPKVDLLSFIESKLDEQEGKLKKHFDKI